MNRLFPIALISLLVIGPMAPAAPSPGAPTSANPDLLDKTRESAEALWEQSSGTVRDLWRKSRESAGDWLERSQETADEAWSSTRDYLEPAEVDHFGQVWDQVLPTLEETLALEERQEALPKSAWFGDDQKSNRRAINELLDQAVAVLSTSDVQHYRDRIRVLQREIATARRDIGEFRRNRVSAPHSSMVKKTVSDYDDAISDRETDIGHYQEELSLTKREFAAELRAMGLELNDEQVEFLLSTVVGDNLIDLGIVFDNVKAITVQLEQLVEKSAEDLQGARRYYGMYLILLKSLHQMHLKVEHAISGKYIPQIDAIIGRAEELTRDTRELMRQSPDKRELLTGNLEAQRLTVQTAGVYRDYLNDQGRQVNAARVELERDIAATWNTYETVRVSGELVGLVKSSRKLLNGLLNRQVPALRPFENLEMQREFEKLTAQLRASEER